jgi:hypothetical protein
MASSNVDLVRSIYAGWSRGDDYRVEADEYRELDGERVLVFIRLSGRGKTSGMKIEEMRPMGANLFEIRDGKVTRLMGYFDREHALTDLDLPPAPPPL